MFDNLLKLFTGDATPEQKRFLVRMSFRFLLVFHIAWACGWLSFLGLSGFAQADTITDLKTEVASIKSSLAVAEVVRQRDAMESEIRRLDQELFAIRARIEEQQSAGQAVDALYTQRFNALTSERNQLNSRLTAFLQANPSVATTAR